MSKQPPSADSDETIIRQVDGEREAVEHQRPKVDPSEIVAHSPEATTIYNPSSPEADDTTILATAAVITDDDQTIMADDNDSTILSPSLEEAETNINVAVQQPSEPDITYVAAIAGHVPKRSSSEAGRLLKNRFVLEQKVGSGGMGDVYKALDLRQQEAQERNPYIAIKILNDNFARHKDAFISLQREATRTRGIPHPNIMGVYDFDREGDTVFMSMELLDGKPLDDYLKDHPEGVSTDDAWNIIDGICQGLSRAHDAGIVHSDFKPGNIYYTDNKIAKVFDFGIARAVKNPNDIEVSEDDRTVFDAGSLGALTPAYASYEMLKGLEPTKSDDIYAVALVTYELFTGKHPYNRVPADKAYEQGLVPEPIPFLKRRHWKALKRALALKGEERTQTLSEFSEGVFSPDPPYFRYALIASLLAISVSLAVYQQFYSIVEEMPEEAVNYQGAFNSMGRNLQERLASPNFENEDWHNQIALNLARLKGLKLQLMADFSEYLEDGWSDQAKAEILTAESDVLAAYLAKMTELRVSAEQASDDEIDPASYENAITSLRQALSYQKTAEEKYHFDLSGLKVEELRLVSLLSKRETQLDGLNRRIQAAIDVEADRLEAQTQAKLNIEREQARFIQHDKDLKDFSAILRCRGDIPDSEITRLGRVINNLRRGYPARFNVDYPGMERALAGCVERIAVREPQRAREVKLKIASFVPESAEISSLEIIDLDLCAAKALIGQGRRNGSWCEDDLVDGGSGPQLVVVPANSAATTVALPSFAISRMEIKISEYNRFCQQAECLSLVGTSSLPATNLSLQQARLYVSWLSEQSGRRYRLPNPSEWRYVASAADRTEQLQSVNCTVDSRGVQLGDKLLNSLSGRPNSWGLYNHVGNAREWAVDGDEIVALGGAHTDPRRFCSVTASVAHSGSADSVTGFRVLREI